MYVTQFTGQQADDAVETGRWILAIGKHLRAFAASDPKLAYLFATRRSAQDGELLFRMRGLGAVQSNRLKGLALDVGIPRQELRVTIERIERATGLIGVEIATIENEVEQVVESILTELEVFRSISALFEDADPDPVERALIPLLEMLSRLPLTQDEVVDRVCQLGYSDFDVRRALDLQEAFHLLHKRRIDEIGTTLVYNEYLWGAKIDKIGPLLGSLGSPETEGLLALIDEVRSNQGQSFGSIGFSTRTHCRTRGSNGHRGYDQN